jgi:hypothetical protein
MHSKALELEHMTFENERLQADLAKMEKVWPIFSETLIHFAILQFLVSIPMTYWCISDT